MSGEGPPDRPPPPPPPDPPKRDSEAEAVTDQGGGPPQDIVERHPADHQASSGSPDATNTPTESIAGPGGSPEASGASPVRDQQLENWKQADVKMYSDQLNRASPEQVGEMRDAAYKEFETTLEQMQTTALKNDPESDAAWRDGFDRNQIAQQRLEMIGEHGGGDRPSSDGRASEAPTTSEPSTETGETRPNRPVRSGRAGERDGTTAGHALEMGAIAAGVHMAPIAEALKPAVELGVEVGKELVTKAVERVKAIDPADVKAIPARVAETWGYEPPLDPVAEMEMRSAIEERGGGNPDGSPPDGGGHGPGPDGLDAEQRMAETRQANIAAEKSAAGAVETARADARAEVIQAERDVGAADKEIRDMEDKAAPTDSADSKRLDDLQKARAEASDRLNENLTVESNPESAAKGGEIQEAERARVEADQAEREAEEARRRQQNP